MSKELVTPQSEIMARLDSLGWQVGKISYSGGYYIAKAKNAKTGHNIERKADTAEMALVAVYNYAQATAQTRRRAISAWQKNWYSDLHDIAKAYADLPPFNSTATEAWGALAKENSVHYQFIANQIDVQFVGDYQPYESPREMADDVHQKQKLLVSTADLNHPLWTDTQVLENRACHDVLGICSSGGGWSWTGANRAAMNHLPLLGELAQSALFVEVIGRTAYQTVYRGLGSEKVGLLDEFLDSVRAGEGVHVVAPKAEWFMSPES